MRTRIGPGPHETLEPGTRVMIIGRMRGVVKESKMVQSSNNSGQICLHTIEYEDGTIKDCNYSFIIVLCSMCDNPAEQYMMCQPMCKECAAKFADLHSKFSNKQK